MRGYLNKFMTALELSYPSLLLLLDLSPAHIFTLQQLIYDANNIGLVEIELAIIKDEGESFTKTTYIQS